MNVAAIYGVEDAVIVFSFPASESVCNSGHVAG